MFKANKISEHLAYEVEANIGDDTFAHFEIVGFVLTNQIVHAGLLGLELDITFRGDHRGIRFTVEVPHLIYFCVALYDTRHAS